MAAQKWISMLLLIGLLVLTFEAQDAAAQGQGYVLPVFI